MKAMISIPVHEKPDVIKDQIENIKKFFPEADIVLHVSKTFFENNRIEDIDNMTGVYINPVHLETNWGDIVMPHISNFHFIESLGIDYNYFVMHSSNDMFVQHGVMKYIEQYDAGFNFRYIKKRNSYWWPSNMVWDDPWISGIQALSGQTKIVASQLEGSFYKRDIICKIMDVIQKSIDCGLDKEKKGHYTREEMFFSTIAENIVPYEKVGRPYVFSEVHRFDRELWKTFMNWDKCYSEFGHFLLPRVMYDRIKMSYNDWKFGRGGYETTPKIVDRIRDRDSKYVEANRFLDDGNGKFELYGEANSLFAVKRVAREYNDKLRVYIRQLD